MSQAHHRKKQPVLVRQHLLEVASRIVGERGMEALTLDAVSTAAGLSKGGLLHHFPTKVSLLDGVFDFWVGDLDRAIEARMRADPVPKGRFTRAYLSAVCAPPAEGEHGAHWPLLLTAAAAEPRLSERWREWTLRRGEDYVGTDSAVDFQIVRLAADGVWLSSRISGPLDPAAIRDLIDRLTALAQP